MSEVKLFRLSGSALAIDLRTGHNATLRPGPVVLSEDAHTHAMAALAAECERLRNQVRGNDIDYGLICKERDAALAELATLKGGQEAVIWRNFDGEGGYDYTDDEETAARWRKINGARYAHWLEPFYAAPPAQASAWAPEGWKPVPVQMTESMLDAAWCACSGLDDGDIRGVWRAMLTATPTPGEGKCD